MSTTSDSEHHTRGQLRTENGTSRQKAQVRFGGRDLSISVGTRICEILGQLYITENHVVGATLNNHIVSLGTQIDGDSSLEAVTCDCPEGQAILRRTATHVFHSVIQKHYPELQVAIGQSLLGGYYYDVTGGVENLTELARDVTAKMVDIVARDVTLERHRISVEAVSRWVKDPLGYKERLLRGWAGPTVNIVGLEDYYEIMHGPCAPSTGCLSGATVAAFSPGLILHFPESATTSPLPVPGQEVQKLFKVYSETRRWNSLIGVSSLGDLNAAALEDRFDEVIHLAEALHEKKIAEIADDITSRRSRIRLVCIAGPSSSGKTTFLRRLSVQLKVNGIEPLPISLDDFYRPREETPRDEKGEYDFESLEALNLTLIDRTLSHLLQGEETRIPRFDFERGQPTEPSTWKKARLQPNQVAVIEGIHGLNPALASSLEPENRYNIFVSALTSLVIDEHNRIFTSDSRLLRRIVRDRRYRGTNAAETIARWPSVRRGEERYIFPFQENSDAMFNSTLLFETAVLRPFAWRYLLEVPRSHPSRVRAYELLKFLELVVPVFPDSIPANSVMREFIGGSGFVY